MAVLLKIKPGNKTSVVYVEKTRVDKGFSVDF